MTTRQINNIKYEYGKLISAKNILNSFILLLEDEHSKLMSIKTLKTFEKFLINNIKQLDGITKSNSYGCDVYYMNALISNTIVFTFKILRDTEKLFNEEILYDLNENLRNTFQSINYKITKMESDYSETPELLNMEETTNGKN